MGEYYGRYDNVLDSKGRINMPARFRDMAEASGDGETFILTRGSERCVVMFPVNEWRRKIREIERQVTDGKERRKLLRHLNFYVSHQKVDKQGRINIPADLIEYAGLKKDVVVLGTGRKIEVWNPEFLEQDVEGLSESYPELTDVLDF
jgi:MraZ protein